MTLTSFLGLEAYALYTRGEDATLTVYARRALGVHPRCRHGHVGRGLLLAALAWIAAHLAFGVLPAAGWLDKS